MGRSAARATVQRGDASPEPAAVASKSATSFVVLGTNYKRASIGARDALARHLASETVRRVLASFEAVPLATCNRCEVYALARAPSAADIILMTLASGPEVPSRDAFYVLHGDDAIRHLIRVAAGLDSVAWGEPQVALQVHAAVQAARAAGRASPILGDLFDRALAEIGRAHV